MLNATETASPYAIVVRQKYDALKTLYAGNNTSPSPVSFWKLGNAFDTIIDYLDTVDSSSANAVAAMVDVQCTDALKHIDGGYDGAWFDDFGWWSVACQRAVHKAYFANHAPLFGDILGNCWSRFTSNAPYVWERRTSGTYDAYAPAVPGGVWNAYWIGTSSRYPGPKNGDPASGTLVGIQNTVTNALYLMAAHRLGHSDPDARADAEREYAFLNA